jgi:hypothetical protein
MRNEEGQSEMKTIILWRRKRARTFKQVGTATADGSAANIASLWRMAQKGDGALAIVDAPTAEHARRAIAAHLCKAKMDIGKPGITGSHGDDRVITLGANAALAIAGASEACRHWDARLARDGRVRVQDTKALGNRSDGVSFAITDAFGGGFR